MNKKEKNAKEVAYLRKISKTNYIIETYIKDFEKEKIVQLPYKNDSLVYVLVKKNTEAEE